MNREEWLNERRTGIGGSDAAAVMGLNPWKSPLDVYLDKTGQLMESPDNPALYWGRVLEEVVAREYSLRTRKSPKKKPHPPPSKTPLDACQPRPGDRRRPRHHRM